MLKKYFIPILIIVMGFTIYLYATTVDIGQTKDTVTGCLAIVPFEHKEIHEGNSYYAYDVDTDMDSTEQKQYIITTPNTTAYAYLVYSIVATVGATLSIYETTTYSGGTAMTEYCRDRNTTAANTTTLKHTPTVASVSGTLIYQELIGVGTAYSGSKNILISRADNEMVLKKNTAYCFELEGTADNNKVSILFDWYEHSSLE